MKRSFTNYRHLKRSVAFGVFKRYNKIKYLLRIKHFRGRAVHSPFMYQIVRKALMVRSKRLTVHEKKMYYFFIANGFNERSSRQLMRLYTYLEFENYAVYKDGYSGEDFIILFPQMGETEVEELSKQICEEHRLACGVINNIYGNSEAHSLWDYMVKNIDAVTVDLFNVGVVFFCEDLQKQNYKMKF